MYPLGLKQEWPPSLQMTWKAFEHPQSLSGLSGRSMTSLLPFGANPQKNDDCAEIAQTGVFDPVGLLVANDVKRWNRPTTPVQTRIGS